MYTGLRKVDYYDTVFENITPVYKKKSPGQPACARVTIRITLQFSRFADLLQTVTYNESLAYKHKNNVINSDVPLRVTTAGMTHFAAVRAPCTRV
jgi:hypothetical protein